MKSTQLALIAGLFLSGMAGCQKDSENGIAPSATATFPKDNAIGVPIYSKFTLTFSVAMDPSTVTSAQFTIRKGDAIVYSSVSYDGTSFTAKLTPYADLESNTQYVLEVSTGAKDMAGKSMTGDYQWNFTTAALSMGPFPTVGEINPVNNAVNVGINLPIVVSFSDWTDMNTVTDLTFILDQDYTIEGIPSVSGAVTYVGRTATFTPDASLLPNTIYVVYLTNGIKSTTGNAFEGMSIYFTTGND